MIYFARTQSGVLGFLLVLTLVSIAPIYHSNGFLYYHILLSIFIFLSIFIKFEFKIGDGYLRYQVILFTLPIYKKVLYPDQINKMKFKRIGWNTKAAIIQVKKGINIRIVHFTPIDIFNNLNEFATKNGIPITKSGDYLLLVEGKRRDGSL